ncbi:MAG: hypothetical protein U5R48_01620 [Gammaproteobacteria bacterium]|nr:hypothetical protein [Gammaproteobacteria bacterium]
MKSLGAEEQLHQRSRVGQHQEEAGDSRDPRGGRALAAHRLTEWPPSTVTTVPLT